MCSQTPLSSTVSSLLSSIRSLPPPAVIGSQLSSAVSSYYSSFDLDSQLQENEVSSPPSSTCSHLEINDYSAYLLSSSMSLSSLYLSLCITDVNIQKVFVCAHTHPFLISAHFHYTQSPLLIFTNCLLLPLPLVDFRHDVYRDKCYSSFNLANYLSYL